MRKLFAIIAVALCATTASAQLNFGVKGGLNVTTMSLSSDVLESSNRTGFYIGPTMKFSVPIVGLGFDVSALYDQREGKVEDITVKQQQIAVPVNIRYQIGLGDLASLLIFAGPQFGFNVGSDEEKIDWNWKSTNLSLNIGAGVMVASHLQINANYNLALGKTGEFDAANALGTLVGKDGIGDGKLNSWQIGLAYYF